MLTSTHWRVEITNGVVDTEEGPMGGWGYLCGECHPPRGEHGYPDLDQALDAMIRHLGRCAGHG